MRLNNTEWQKMRELSVVVKLHDLQHRVAGNIPQVPENEFMPRLPETAVVKLQDSSVPLGLSGTHGGVIVINTLVSSHQTTKSSEVLC